MKTKIDLTSLGLLFLRLFFGFTMLIQHGIGKYEKLINSTEIHFPDPFGIGAFPTLVLVVIAEVSCSMLIAAGLFTRWALLPLIITMFVAVFVIHSADDISKIKKGLLYSAGFITLLCTGPGEYSLDAFLNIKKQ